MDSGVGKAKKVDPDTGAVLGASPVIPVPAGQITYTYSSTVGADGRLYAAFQPNYRVSGPPRLQWLSIDGALAGPWTLHTMAGPLDVNVAPGVLTNLNLECVVPVGDKIYGFISYYRNFGSQAYYQIVKGNLDGTGNYSLVGPERVGGQSLPHGESFPEMPVAVGTNIYFTQQGPDGLMFDTLTGTYYEVMTVPFDLNYVTATEDLQALVARSKDLSVWALSTDDVSNAPPFPTQVQKAITGSVTPTPVGAATTSGYNFSNQTGGGVIDEPYYRFALVDQADPNGQKINFSRVNMDTGVVELNVASWNCETTPNTAPYGTCFMAGQGVVSTKRPFDIAAGPAASSVRFLPGPTQVQDIGVSR
jgi:hypothetical protein